MKGRVLYIHGYRTQGESGKAVYLRQWFDVVSLDYDPADPRGAIEALAQQAAAFPDAIVVGSSLGGFFAYGVAKRLGRQVVLINPCVFPSRVIPDFDAPLESAYAALERDLYRAGGDPPTLVLLEAGDEVLDPAIARQQFQERAEVRVFPGGSHRFENREALRDALADLFRERGA